MTVNKAQGKTIPNAGIYLPEPVFSHGQLYVSLSRSTTRKNVKILVIPDTGNKEKNSNDSKKEEFNRYVYEEHRLQRDPYILGEIICTYNFRNYSFIFLTIHLYLEYNFCVQIKSFVVLHHAIQNAKGLGRLSHVRVQRGRNSCQALHVPKLCVPLDEKLRRAPIRNCGV
jgi:hypothetical protein